jgi:hypothetical protein
MNSLFVYFHKFVNHHSSFHYNVISINNYQAFPETTLQKKGPSGAASTLIVYIGFRCCGPAAGEKNGQSNRNRNFWSTVPKAAVVGLRIS